MDPCLLIVYWRRKVVKIINKSNEVFSDKTLGFNYFRFTSICSTCHISFWDVAVTLSSSWDVHVEEVSNLSGRQCFAKDSSHPFIANDSAAGTASFQEEPGRQLKG